MPIQKTQTALEPNETEVVYGPCLYNHPAIVISIDSE